MIRKIIAPVIIAILTVAAIVVYFGFIACMIDQLWIQIIVVAVLVALTAVMVWVTIARIKEIKKEDIDDVVSKY